MLRNILTLSCAMVLCVQACGEPPLKQAVHYPYSHNQGAAFKNATSTIAAAAAGSQVYTSSSSTTSFLSTGAAAAYSSAAEYSSSAQSSSLNTLSTMTIKTSGSAAAAAPSSSASLPPTLTSTSSAMSAASISTSSGADTTSSSLAAYSTSSSGSSSPTLASTSSALPAASISTGSAAAAAAASSSSLLEYSYSAAAAPVSSSSTTASPASPSPASSTTSSSSSSASPASGTSKSKALPYTDGISYSASFTQYGAGDTYGSGNCNTNTVACGFFSPKVFQAAASQNLFGVGPGAGAGPACGTCWKLTPQTDSTGKPLVGAQETIVQVNNLCPIDNNPLCSQPSLGATNSLGATVNFDLCIDDGASTHFFGSSGTALGKGTATAVDCSLLAQR